MELSEVNIGYFCANADILFLIKLNNLINEEQIIYNFGTKYDVFRLTMGYKLINIYRQDSKDGIISGYTLPVWLNSFYERFKISPTHGKHRQTFTSDDVSTEIRRVFSRPIPTSYVPPGRAPKHDSYLKYLKYKNKYIALKKMLNQ
jgi:hypothetical protein